MRAMRALVIQANGRAEVVWLGEKDQWFPEIQWWCGGDVTMVVGQNPDRPRDWAAWCNEEGRPLRMLPNPAATQLAEFAGWVSLPGDYLAGPVVFTGLTGGRVSHATLGLLRAAVRLDIIPQPVVDQSETELERRKLVPRS
jgi:hypothetical protein